MIEVVKKYNVLEIEDVERLVSKMAGRNVKINEMDVALIDGVPYDARLHGCINECYMGCEISVDGEEICDSEEYDSPLDEYMPEEPFTPENLIFAFDTSMFKSFVRYADSSD